MSTEADLEPVQYEMFKHSSIPKPSRLYNEPFPQLNSEGSLKKFPSITSKFTVSPANSLFVSNSARQLPKSVQLSPRNVIYRTFDKPSKNIDVRKTYISSNNILEQKTQSELKIMMMESNRVAE